MGNGGFLGRWRDRFTSARAGVLRSLVALPIRRGIKGYAPPERPRREIHDVPTTPLMSDAEWKEFMDTPPERKSDVMERFLAKHRCRT